MLLGGKLGDLFGRKWTFIAGLVGFAVASAIGGLAQSFGMLIAARALQGAFGALLAPSALSLLTVTFAGSPDRAKAFGIFGAIAGGGASVGLILGGVLTQTLSWRWCLYVNLLIAVPTVFVALSAASESSPGGTPRIDVPGVLLSCGGLFALVFGFSNAETHSWTTPLTIISLAASVVLLAASWRSRASGRDPLLPLHIVRDRARGGSYLSILLAGAGVFAVFLFLTYYMQENLGFSPIKTGLSFLPLTAVLVVTSTTVQTKLIYRTGREAAGRRRDDARIDRDAPADPPLPGRQLREPRPARHWSSLAWGWAASSHRRSAPPHSESTAPRRASPRRWSTPPSRLAARSAPRC